MHNISKLPAIQGFVRLCSDGWAQGWHERNGGNLSYRMTEEEVSECRSAFRYERPWTKMNVCDARLAGAHFIVTGSGKYMRNIALDIPSNIGILELNSTGDAWRIVWGLQNGAKPTSEFDSHYLCHITRSAATNGLSRVLYHAHPAHVVALTFLLPLTDAAFSRVLWKSLTECPMVFPEGVGVVPCMVPGGAEIALATRAAMERYAAVIWAQHGLFSSGADFDEAFGLMHIIEKAAEIYLLARSAAPGGKVQNTIPDEVLRGIARSYGKELNEALLAQSGAEYREE